MYRVVIMPSVRRDIRRLPSGYTRLVFGRIRSLAENPRPRGTRRLQGTNEYRLRIGVYRAVYTIDGRGSRRYRESRSASRRSVRAAFSRMTAPPVGLGDADSDDESGGFIIDLDSREHSRAAKREGAVQNASQRAEREGADGHRLRRQQAGGAARLRRLVGVDRGAGGHGGDRRSPRVGRGVDSVGAGAEGAAGAGDRCIGRRANAGVG